MAFGLRNQRGSCWINAALQGVFRIPDLQKRFDDEEADKENPVEMCLQEVWRTEGEDGLKDLYQCIKTKPNMPAGDNIGDSHELLEFLCDKVPFLDKLMRFSIVQRLQCKNCPYRDERKDSMIEFSIVPSEKRDSVSSAIAEAVKPIVIDDWKCEKCGKQGCTKQLLVENFPQVMTFHMTSVDTELIYPVLLTVNKHKYALMSVVCFTGGHWMTYGRNMPPGSAWYVFDDNRIQSYDSKYWPVVNSMRLLMYYRIDE